MDYATTELGQIAARITELAGKPVNYHDVETNGAATAAQLISQLV